MLLIASLLASKRAHVFSPRPPAVPQGPCVPQSPIILDLTVHPVLRPLSYLYCPQVHDELLFEVSSSHLARVAALVRQVMEGVAGVWGLQLLMPVKVRVGPSWGHLELFEPPATQQQ